VHQLAQLAELALATDETVRLYRQMGLNRTTSLTQHPTMTRADPGITAHNLHISAISALPGRRPDLPGSFVIGGLTMVTRDQARTGVDV
jgi:hypothetical protein